MKKVLIVAKCIVNICGRAFFYLLNIVLIVAKCIVNYLFAYFSDFQYIVLIVAKCIVNKLGSIGKSKTAAAY